MSLGEIVGKGLAVLGSAGAISGVATDVIAIGRGLAGDAFLYERGMMVGSYVMGTSLAVFMAGKIIHNDENSGVREDYRR